MAVYSIVLRPSKEVIDLVADMKSQLKSRAGWYNSCNSEAHITILTFSISTKSVINKLLSQLEFNASLLEPLNLTFDSFSRFKNSGTLCILPCDNILIQLKELTNNLRKNIKIPEAIPTYNPHITIGRNLNEQQLLISQALFNEIDFHFYCQSVVLRELNETKGQYDVIAEFPFLSQQGVDNIRQQSLF